MKKYVEVFWCPWSHTMPVMQTLFAAPKPIFSVLSTKRKDAKFLKCPALKETLKNEFVIAAPFDLNITINKDTQEIFTDRFGQEFYNAFIINRILDTLPDYPYMLSLPPSYVFYSKDNVEIEIKDVSLMTSQSTSNIKVVPGGFNISKWVRPLELAVEVVDPSKGIEMRMGDPLFSVKFITPDNVPVKLTRVELTKELREKAVVCGQVKSFIPNLKLPQLYKMAESYLSLLIKK